MSVLETTREYRAGVRLRSNQLQCQLGNAFHVKYWPSMSLVIDGDVMTLDDGGAGSLISVDLDDSLDDLSVTLDARRSEPLMEQFAAKADLVSAAWAKIGSDVRAGRFESITEAERAAKALLDDLILDEFEGDDD